MMAVKIHWINLVKKNVMKKELNFKSLGMTLHDMPFTQHEQVHDSYFQ